MSKFYDYVSMSIFNDLQILLGIKKNVPPQTPQEPRRKVLIVEDDKSLAGALKDAFISAGFEVLHAENGQVGLDMAKTKRPDIILLDLIMPVMNGRVMLRKLREIEELKRLPVIVLTNAGEIENIRQTVTFDNAIEFLIKSNVSLDEVVEKVKRTH